MGYLAQILVKILNDIKNYLDDVNNPKLVQECKSLEHHLSNYSISAMTAYRLRKICKLDKSSLSSNKSYLKKEIDELIYLLTHLVSWHCKVCDKTIETENEHQLPLLVTAHEISNEHKKSTRINRI